jgi:capsular exopolysaccharide synthesis family protein
MFPLPTQPVHEIFLALKRHRWLIVATGFIGLIVGVGFLAATEPVYTAESSVLVDARKPRVAEIPGFQTEPKVPEIAELRSEVEVLRNEGLIQRVIEELRLVDEPEFWGRSSLTRQTINGLRNFARETAPWIFEWVPILRADDQKIDPVAAARFTYRQHLNVGHDGRSFVIRVRYTMHDPELAARIVNRHVQLYVEEQVESKRKDATKASDWLKEEVANARNTLLATEAELQRVRESNEAARGSSSAILAEQLGSINQQLAAASGDRAAAEARLRNIRQLVRAGRAESEATVLDSPDIQHLRQQELVLVRKKADLLTIFGEQHPNVLKTEAEARDVRSALQQAVSRLTDRLTNEVTVARTRESELRAKLIEVESRALAADRGETRQRDLERQAATDRDLYNTLLTRYKQVMAQAGMQLPDAKILSSASVPAAPSYPDKRLYLPMIFIGSTFFGVVLAFGREAMRRGFKGSSEVEAEIELPSLGSIPMVPRAVWKSGAPHDLIIDRPNSSFAEAVRGVMNMIEASPTDAQPPRVLLITSSLPNEGKSVLAIALARSYADTGRRTLLIDCDVRNPSLTKMAGAERNLERPDLTMVLMGKAELGDAVQKDRKSSLYLVAADAPGQIPHGLVTSSGMAGLLREARQNYDVVILDSPPITAVSDPLTLSRIVDATILAVRWGDTPREIAKTSLNRLFQNGARLCGAVLTQVDMRRGVFSPAELEYYHRKNRHYYLD